MAGANSKIYVQVIFEVKGRKMNRGRGCRILQKFEIEHDQRSLFEWID